ncbi:chromate transporter [Paenibacillus mendelii]|uniref:Chromate transporter n=1 Tax=Paenibacillus mendelii TaxID=206163 RepID=A0ABV6JKM5_9BACL|nr:chromate transporter [Paenibacillus mendelii]MCQ6559173.1 chromate transporter [Paenibacillus mendelii]
MLWELFIAFLKIGFSSFGGGYAAITLIQYEVESHNWMSIPEFQEIVALAGMAPGPIATNSATLIGYHIGGISGAVISTLGVVFPSFFIIVIIATFLSRIHHNQWVKSSFYGLRPIIASLIAYAAIHFGFMGKSAPLLDWSTLATLVICAGALFGIIKYKMHPVTIIVASGLAGIILF